MHIAFITSEYPHEKSSNAGGIGTSIKNLAEAIVKTGNKASIFIYGQNSQENFIENGVSIYLIESKEYYFFKWSISSRHAKRRLCLGLLWNGFT